MNNTDIIIPEKLRNIDTLTGNEKILLADIWMHTLNHGTCMGSSAYFAERHPYTENSVQKKISKFDNDYGFITRKTVNVADADTPIGRKSVRTIKATAKLSDIFI